MCDVSMCKTTVLTSDALAEPLRPRRFRHTSTRLHDHAFRTQVLPCVTATLICASLAACGGGDSSSAPASPPIVGQSCSALPPAAPERRASLSASELLAAANGSSVDRRLMDFVGTPVCGVDVHYLNYSTIGGAGERTSASGALLVPTGNNSQCSGPRPIVLYGHGTTTLRQANIASIRENGTAQSLAIAFASHGYIVVAPNYAGYDCSELPYHPYLNAAQQSQEMLDALNAARRALPTATAPNVRDGGKLFVSGYSQGGHVAMATHRAIEASGGTITASAPMSGPYALLTSIDMSARGEVGFGSSPPTILISASFQRAYGDLYVNANETFEDRYASGIGSLLPSTTPIGQLYSQGRLPQYQIYSAMPPAPQYASLTPPVVPAEHAARYALGFGPDNLIKNSARLARLQDIEANPDGAYPTLTTGRPAVNPRDPARRAYKANDLRTFAPVAPMLLCGGSGDPLVPLRHIEFMQRYWAATGASPPVSTLDVDAAPSGPYADLQAAFDGSVAVTRADAIAGGATDNGDRAVLEAYHPSLVFLYCIAATRRFFDSQ
jgi:alpha/beta superfamily hydrolase